MTPEAVAKWRDTMSQVGPDGLTGFQRRGLSIKAAKLAKDPDAYKKWGAKVQESLGDEGRRRRNDKISAAKNHGVCRHDLKRYRNIVAYHSRIQDLSDLPNFDKWKKGHELDHKFSILEGYMRGIDPRILARKHNLRFIPKQENRAKSFRSSITIDQLLSPQ